MDVQALAEAGWHGACPYTVELAPIEGVPGVRLFCDFRDFCVNYSRLCALVAKVQDECADGLLAARLAGGEALKLEVGTAGTDGGTALRSVERVGGSQEQDAGCVAAVA